MHPLLILLVGMATILGGILGLRLNAFLALITAAVVGHLLVPLARSGYTRTNRYYLKYLLAIAAGAGATHTLVPPTPGPLAVAGTLGVDLGTMVLVGLVVSLPAAGVGLLFAGWVDRRMPVVPRTPAAPALRGSDAEPAVTQPFPGLVPSLLPIILPVLLISSNTVVLSMTARPGAHLDRKSVV